MKIQIRKSFARARTRLFRGQAPILASTFAACGVLIVLALSARGQDTTGSAKEQERELIQILQSDSAPDQKAITCKKLAVYGSEEAVPALAPLLADERLASWARIALEAIPGPASDKALRDAAERLNGKLLIGVINSIGVRRDAKAVNLLAGKLKDNDSAVACAAAVSLGKIGGTHAATALRRALGKAPDAVRPAIAEGSVRCAENLVAEGKRSDAVKLYDAVCQASLPKQKILEGVRGAILARGSAGIPLLLTQLQSSDRDYFNIGLRVARELPGTDASEAVARMFRQANPERRPLLLLALGDRGDAVATTVVTGAAKDGEKPVRLAAIEVLDRAGDPSALPVLLNDATDPDPEIAQPSLAALARLAGSNVDSELFNRLGNSSGRMRWALITVAGRRGIERALSLVVQSVGDPDSDIRAAAIQALTALGGNNEVAELAQALKKSNDPAERSHIENVIVTLSGRSGAACVPPLLSLLQSNEAQDRKAALHALVAAGGSDALAAIANAMQDSSQAVQDEAVHALSTWPNAWPEDASVADPLLHIAKTDGNSAHQVLAVGGYLHFLLGDENLKSEDKFAKLRDVMPLLQRREEKVTAIAVLQSIPAPAALDILEGFASETAVADDACVALVQTATQNKASLSIEDRRKALQVAAEKSTSEKTRRKAESALKNLQ